MTSSYVYYVTRTAKEGDPLMRKPDQCKYTYGPGTKDCLAGFVERALQEYETTYLEFDHLRRATTGPLIVYKELVEKKCDSSTFGQEIVHVIRSEGDHNYHMTKPPRDPTPVFEHEALKTEVNRLMANLVARIERLEQNWREIRQVPGL